jgi:FO synthase
MSKMLKAMEPGWREISWEQALSGASLPVARLLEKSLDGGALDFDEGLALTAVEGDDLLALVKVADELRRRTVGDCITYVVNRNLNFTNVCIVGCAFCGFSRGPNSPDAYFHSTETLVAKSVEAVERGATEVCIQGGLPKDPGGYYADLFAPSRRGCPSCISTPIHRWRSSTARKTGMALHDYLLMLKEAGLGSIPGTAAEILDDKVRRELSPNKLKVRQWVDVIRAAHGLGIPSTCTMMYGHTERPEHWVRHLLLLREIQKDTRGFTEFVPLGFIHSQTALFRTGHARAGSSLREDPVHARTTAAARPFPISGSWVKLGLKVLGLPRRERTD